MKSNDQLEAPELIGWTVIAEDRPSSAFEGEPVVPFVLRVPVWSFYSGQSVLETERPIEITLTHGESQYLAESDALRIVAVGENVEEAFSDFSDQVFYFFRHYASLGDDEVVGDGVHLRELFQHAFRERVLDAA